MLVYNEQVHKIVFIPYMYFDVFIMNVYRYCRRTKKS